MCAPPWLPCAQRLLSGRLMPFRSWKLPASQPTPRSMPAGSRRGAAAWRPLLWALPPMRLGAAASWRRQPPPFLPKCPAAAAAEVRRPPGRASRRRPSLMSWRHARRSCRGSTPAAAQSSWCRLPGVSPPRQSGTAHLPQRLRLPLCPCDARPGAPVSAGAAEPQQARRAT